MRSFFSCFFPCVCDPCSNNSNMVAELDYHSDPSQTQETASLEATTTLAVHTLVPCTHISRQNAAIVQKQPIPAFLRYKINEINNITTSSSMARFRMYAHSALCAIWHIPNRTALNTRFHITGAPHSLLFSPITFSISQMFLTMVQFWARTERPRICDSPQPVGYHRTYRLTWPSSWRGARRSKCPLDRKCQLPKCHEYYLPFFESDRHVRRKHGRELRPQPRKPRHRTNTSSQTCRDFRHFMNTDPQFVSKFVRVRNPRQPPIVNQPSSCSPRARPHRRKRHTMADNANRTPTPPPPPPPPAATLQSKQRRSPFFKNSKKQPMKPGSLRNQWPGKLCASP